MTPPVWLASRSPRRRQLLEEAGIVVRVAVPEIDDGLLTPGRVSPEQWVMALAYLKARWVAEYVPSAASGLVLGADTVCVVDGEVLGQPADAAAALAMLVRLEGREHETMTGVCVMAGGCVELLFIDRAIVRCGEIGDDGIRSYVDSGLWRGKAGGYNLAERLEAGWPVTCFGDPATVMGLPMGRLRPWLERHS